MISRLASLTGRFLVFWAIWWSLTGGRTDGLAMGAGFAAAAALMPLLLAGAQPASSTGLGSGSFLPTVLRGLLLLPFFLWQSLAGGVDVALRALKPRLPLAPTVFDYRLRLPPGAARVTMATLVSLMPGTLATVNGARLRLHVLDATRGYQDELELLEAQVAWVFGVPLRAPRVPDLWWHGRETDA